MKLLVFGKARQTKDGRNFTAYVSKLPKKDGTELTVGVKFREECGSPKLDETPCYIEVNKDDANLSTKSQEITTEDGEIKDVTNHTLWIKAWNMSPEKYVDHSLDEFDI